MARLTDDEKRLIPGPNAKRVFRLQGSDPAGVSPRRSEDGPHIVDQSRVRQPIMRKGDSTMRSSLAAQWLVLVLVVGAVGMAYGSGSGLNVLATVHAYQAAGQVVLPISGVVKWLGGSTTYRRPTIAIQLGRSRLSLKEGSNTCDRNGKAIRLAQATTVYGGTACLPARVLADLLGFTVTYVDRSQETASVSSGGSPSELDKMGGNHFLRLSAGNRTARVLVHEEPPSVVTKVIQDLQNSTQRDAADRSVTFRLGTYGTDWILQVKRIHSGFFASTVPAQADSEMYPGHVVFFTDAEGVYGVKQGKWRFLLGMQNNPSFRAWDAAGIPRNLAAPLGFKLENY